MKARPYEPTNEAPPDPFVELDAEMPAIHVEPEPGQSEKTPQSIPMPKLGDVEVFMPEDVAHALHIFDVAVPLDETSPAVRGKAMRHVMMFALQAAAVNLGVKPDSMITERPIGMPPSPTDKRAKVKAARKANKIRRKPGWPRS